MNRKKILSLIVAAALSAMTLAGCGGGDTGSSAPADEQTPAETTTAAPDDIPDEPPVEVTEGEGAGLKIAIVSSPNGVDDGSFNEDNYDGILAFIAKYPDATVTAVQEPNIANSVQAVAEIVADYDVIVVPGFQFAGIGQIAQENPEKKFVLIDSYPTDAEGNEVAMDNIYAMTFKEHESGFYAGIAAAKETQTGKVAVVNGIAYPSNVNYQYGFEAGVNYANAKLGTTAQIVEMPSNAGTDVTGANVGGNYIGNFDDEAGGKVLGNTLISEGCDIIFVAAGNAGNGVFTAAKENGNVKVIGCDVDQYDDGVSGDANIILTSVLKNMSINVERVLDSIQSGSFQGGNQLMGADTDSTGYVSESGRHQLSDEALTAMADAQKLVKDGTIVPPDNFSGTSPEDFPGLS